MELILNTAYKNFDRYLSKYIGQKINCLVISANPEKAIQIFTAKVDKYRFYNTNEMEISSDHIPYINRINLSRQLTPQEEKEIQIILNPSISLYYATKDDISNFALLLNKYIKKEAYVPPFKRKLILENMFNKLLSEIIDVVGLNLELITQTIEEINLDLSIDENILIIKSKSIIKKDTKIYSLNKEDLLRMFKLDEIKLTNINKQLIIQNFQNKFFRLQNLENDFNNNILSNYEFTHKNYQTIIDNFFKLSGNNILTPEEITTIIYTIEKRQKIEINYEKYKERIKIINQPLLDKAEQITSKKRSDAKAAEKVVLDAQQAYNDAEKSLSTANKSVEQLEVIKTELIKYKESITDRQKIKIISEAQKIVDTDTEKAKTELTQTDNEFKKINLDKIKTEAKNLNITTALETLKEAQTATKQAEEYSKKLYR